MANGFGASPFVLPNMFSPPGQALQQGLAREEARKEREFERDYRLQKDKEADDWRKLRLIQDLTDIDKYQTGESVADAIGFQKANDLFSKYTSLSSSMSPAELQYKIAQDIGGLTNSMQAMKDDLVMGDAQVKALKQKYPSLDTNSLLADYRADVLGRRINLNTNEFLNPIKVPQSQLDLSNPDFLSDYIDVNKGLRDAVVNPKNIQKDVTVLRGSPSSYVGYQGDLPFYMKDDFETKGGFYNEKPEPTMSLKTSVIPRGAFSGADKDIEVLDTGAYEGLISENPEAEIALRKLAKSKYQNYNSMSDVEKEIARRDVAKDFITPFSANYQYRAKTATKPPRSTTNVYMGASDSRINDIYKGIDESLSEMESKGSVWLPVSVLKPDAKEVVMKAAKLQDDLLTPDELQIIRGDDGTLRVFKRNGDFVNYVPRVATNIGKQPNVQAKKEVVAAGEPGKGETKVDFSKLDPNGFKKEGNNWRYKDGRLFDSKGNLIKNK